MIKLSLCEYCLCLFLYIVKFLIVLLIIAVVQKRLHPSL
jgi:hypothetical protein